MEARGLVSCEGGRTPWAPGLWSCKPSPRVASAHAACGPHCSTSSAPSPARGWFSEEFSVMTVIVLFCYCPGSGRTCSSPVRTITCSRDPKASPARGSQRPWRRGATTGPSAEVRHVRVARSALPGARFSEHLALTLRRKCTALSAEGEHLIVLSVFLTLGQGLILWVLDRRRRLGSRSLHLRRTVADWSTHTLTHTQPATHLDVHRVCLCATVCHTARSFRKLLAHCAKKHRLLNFLLL